MDRQKKNSLLIVALAWGRPLVQIPRIEINGDFFIYSFPNTGNGPNLELEFGIDSFCVPWCFSNI